MLPAVFPSRQAKLTDVGHKQRSSRRSDSLIEDIIKGKVEKVRHLLNQGGFLDNKTDKEMSPLVAALHIDNAQKRSRMFDMLLREGADYRVRDRSQRTVMHWACAMGHHEQVSSLLENTAGDMNLSERDQEGLTALHHAINAGSLTTVDVLVEFHVRFGVPVDIPDNLGLTPYIYARRQGFKDIAHVLHDKGQACKEHADNLFRSAREWSMIGRTERKRILNSQIQEQLKKAHIMGKYNLTKQLGRSLHLANLNNFNGATNHNLDQANVHRMEPSNQTFLQTSPYLEETHTANNIVKSTETDTQPLCLVKLPINETKHEHINNTLKTGDFLQHENSYSLHDTLKASPSNHLGSNFAKKVSLNTFPKKSLTPSLNNNYHAQSLTFHSEMPYTTRSPQNDSKNFVNEYKQYYKNDSSETLTHKDSVTKTHTQSLDVLSLIKETFPKGRIASEFHNSEFDSNKMTEYKYMLGNLNNLMNILSDQKTKSFRNSVKVQRPLTPIVNLENKKNPYKISTWAILFGDKKEGRPRIARSHQSSVKVKTDDTNEKKCRKEKKTKKIF